ncbi:CsbD family protein [Sphingomonas sp. GB1N7]|uniref:CsbD family protein n=1 Tax=Parasphingomonas caseinilytica TaxID=3096158 RepID=UPI002FC70F25
MNENRVEGLAKEAKGSIKEAIGKLTGDTTTEAEGKVEKVAGKAQAAAGKDIDTAEDVQKK